MSKYPVPNWTDTSGGVFDCDDENIKIIAFACEHVHGFDLPRFDIWLANLPDGDMKTDLIERRDNALSAFEAHKDTALPMLEFLHAVWTYEREKDFILPLARGAHSQKKKRVAAMEKARSSRSRHHDWGAVEAKERELLASGTPRRDIAGKIESSLGVPKSTYRDWRRKKATV